MITINPAKRAQSVNYAIRDIIAEAKSLISEDTEILPLNIGDPNKFDFQTPSHLIDAVKRDLAKYSSYAPSEGTVEARTAVAQFQQQLGNKIPSIDDVLITTGGAEAIQLSLNALLNKGDRILLPSPGYPAYQAQANFLEATIDYYELDEDDNWQINIANLEKQINDKTKVIVLINPNNPTGTVFTKETIIKVLKLARDNNLLVIADEQVYPYYVFDGELIMTASLGIDVPIITIGSISKTFLAPGWRIGWIVFNNMDEQLKETIKKLKRVVLGSPHPLQSGIDVALRGDMSFLKETRKKLITRRDVVVQGISKIKDLSVVTPRGAFYAFVKIEKNITSDKEFVLELAKETGILCVPGEGFGQREGTHHFRLVFLPPEEIINKAMEKLSDFTKRY